MVSGFSTCPSRGNDVSETTVGIQFVGCIRQWEVNRKLKDLHSIKFPCKLPVCVHHAGLPNAIETIQKHNPLCPLLHNQPSISRLFNVQYKLQKNRPSHFHAKIYLSPKTFKSFNPLTAKLQFNYYNIFQLLPMQTKFSHYAPDLCPFGPLNINLAPQTGYGNACSSQGLHKQVYRIFSRVVNSQHSGVFSLHYLSNTWSAPITYQYQQKCKIP